MNYIIIVTISLLLNACVEQRPGSSDQSKNSERTVEATEKAEQLWAYLKDKNFSDTKQAEAGWEKIHEVLELPAVTRAAIIQKLVSYKQGTMGIIHKMLSGAINDARSKAIITMMHDLANNAAKKAWFEQVHSGEDAFSMVFVRASALKGDESQALKNLLREMAQLELSTTLTAAKIWNVVRKANFAIKDDNYSSAMKALVSLSDLPAANVRKALVKELSTKADIIATNSGLLQSMVQGAISKEIVKISQIFIEDQGDSKAKKDFVNQKLGSLKERAMHYLLQLNISKKAAADGPGVRLADGALVSEQPHLNNLIALLTANGADSRDIITNKSSQVTVDLVLNELNKDADKSLFINLVENRVVAQEDLLPIVAWAIQDKNRAEAFKTYLTNKKVTISAKRMFKSRAFISALDTDINNIVIHNNPKKTGGFLGARGQEWYVDEVALKNFNRLLENDYGLLSLIADTDFDQGNQGTLIGILLIHVAGDRQLHLSKRKAVVRTLAHTLKSKIPHQGLWEDLVNKKLSSNENSIDILVQDMQVSEQEAKALLLVK